MPLSPSRRELLRRAAMAAVVAATSGCGPDRAPGDTDSGPTVPEVPEDWPTEWRKSVCRFCGTGCGVELGTRGGKLVALRGDAAHPTTLGLVCAKSLFLPKVVNSPDRLTSPMIRRDGRLVQVTWDRAMTEISDRFAAAIREHGPDSVAFYGSGQLTIEESYLANRIFKGGIGTNNVEGNPRLCMASAVGGYVSTFGKDEPMGCYEDISHARVFFLIGSNTAECHPVLFNRILLERQRGRGIQVIVLDPRRNPTATVADLFLQPAPGADLLVLNAMAQVILAEGLHDPAFLSRHVQFRRAAPDGSGPETLDLDAYREFLAEYTPERVELRSGVPRDAIRRAARLFAQGPSMSLWTMGLNQRVAGVWANNLVHNLHLLTGQIGKPGMTPFSLTGQPNACGGVRDTGSLCHVLPYGRSLASAADRAELERLWGSRPGTIRPRPGLHTMKLFEAVAAGKIRALLVMCTNPGQSLPDLGRWRAALGPDHAERPFLVVMDIFPTRTTELADVVLPAAMWAEKEGVYGMSERRYQFHPKVVDPPAPSCKSDFQFLLWFAKGLQERGILPEKFAWQRFQTPADLWEEIRRASRGTAYDFWGMTRPRLERERGLRWPCPDEDHPGTARRYVKGEDPLLDRDPQYRNDSLSSGQISFYAAPDRRAVIWLRPWRPPAEPPDGDYPFTLSTGRVLEHWHSGTMTMRVDELRRAAPRAYAEIHPADAAEVGVKNGERLRIVSRRGQVELEARVVPDGPRRGMVFVPWCWEDDSSLINLLTIDAIDPGSKQPEFKLCAVRLETL